jgi:peptide chain release factor
MPFPVELPPDILAIAAELQLKPEDVEERFVRGSGHGGQKINKTSSTVQLVHLPTGMEVKVQKHREQSKNRLSAWKLLILKIEEKEKGEESRLQQEAFKIRKQKQKRSKRAQAKVLDEKSKRGTVKEARRGAWEEWREGV